MELTISEGGRSEFRCGSFQRSIALPANANADKVAATYTDGILQVTVPLNKAEKPETTKVAITKG